MKSILYFVLPPHSAEQSDEELINCAAEPLLQDKGKIYFSLTLDSKNEDEATLRRHTGSYSLKTYETQPMDPHNLYMKNITRSCTRVFGPLKVIPATENESIFDMDALHTQALSIKKVCCGYEPLTLNRRLILKACQLRKENSLSA
jgi:hypothetical protein